MWEQRVAAWRTGGLSAARFCAGRDFPESALRYWARRLGPLSPGVSRVTGAPSPVVRLARVEVALPAPRPVQARAAAVAAVAAAPGAITIAVGAVRIAVARGFDRATLAAVLEVVAASRGARP